MLLKGLRKNKIVTVNYYKNGFLNTCKGYIYKLNLDEQTISLKDEKHNIFSIRFSWISEVY